MNKSHLLAGAMAGTLAFSVPLAQASGIQSLEQNASGIGTAYAGSAAVADNASTIYYNPAGLTRLPGGQISLGLVGVHNSIEFNNHGSWGATGGDGGDAGQWRSLPNAYLSWALSPDWSLGLGISSPYSLHNEYDDGWRGRRLGVEARLRSVNINPAVAYRVSERISLGLGLNHQTLKLDTGVENALGQLERLDGKDSAWGWNAGALFTLSDAMRVGVAYRSSMEFDLEQAQPFPGVDARGKLKTPGTFTLSVWQQVSPRWEAMGDLSYTHWKTMDGMQRNSWRFAWGAAYQYNDAWKSRFGIAYDRSPLRNGDLSALMPDHHRIWFSIGGQYKPSPTSALDFGYAYQWLKKPGIDQQAGGVGLRGDYDASGHVIGVQFTQSF